MEKLPNIHPGEVLSEEFLKPMEISAYRLSKDLRILQTRISEIIKRNRRITADTALRLSKYFGTTAKFWLGLQNDFDLEEEEKSKAEELAAIEKVTSAYRIYEGSMAIGTGTSKWRHSYFNMLREAIRQAGEIILVFKQ